MRNAFPATILLALAVAGPTLAATTPAADEPLSLRGQVGVEYLRLPRFEAEAGGVRLGNPLQKRENLALRGQLDANRRFDAHWNAAARVFWREDVRNDDRDALRLDELWLQYGTSRWDLRVGNQLVTWGSVESVSPLDVINPRDYEEDIVEPVKVGLGMARARWRFASSDISLYWLPVFEASRYAGPQSYYAIGGGLPNDYPPKQWDASQWAARYFRSADDLDIGVSYLSGLERNASFDPDASGLRLAGRTYRSRRFGTDVTYVAGDLVWKLETVYRTSGEEGNRRALLYALGGEYTYSGVWRHADLTFFVELLGSSRNVRDIELMQNDLFAALRWTINDRLKQRLQLGTFQDLDRRAYVWRIEHQLSLAENVDVGARWTITRNYYPGPLHVESGTGVFHAFLRYNF